MQPYSGNYGFGDEDEEEGAAAGEEVDDEEEDNREQIKILREHAATVASMTDVSAAEHLFERALELDPMNLITLDQFACFLHHKRGELARAEAFFKRGMQVCLPQVDLMLNSPSVSRKITGGAGVSGKISMIHDLKLLSSDASSQKIGKPNASPSNVKLRHIIRFMLNFASFLTKAKGDIEAASKLYQKATELAPKNPYVLGTYGHFLTQEGEGKSVATAMELFKEALRLDPANALYAMWYGKLLKKQGKTGQAELMYRVAMDKSVGDAKLEPTAICNYATFIYKKRKNLEKAVKLFQEGLMKFPAHKGLLKNYCGLLKLHPEFGSEQEVRNRAPKSPSKKAVRLMMSAEYREEMASRNGGTRGSDAFPDVTPQQESSTKQQISSSGVAMQQPQLSPTKSLKSDSDGGASAITHNSDESIEGLINPHLIERVKGTPTLSTSKKESGKRPPPPEPLIIDDEAQQRANALAVDTSWKEGRYLFYASDADDLEEALRAEGTMQQVSISPLPQNIRRSIAAQQSGEDRDGKVLRGNSFLASLEPSDSFQKEVND